MLLPTENCELYIEPQLDSGSYASGQDVGVLYDYSGKNRVMTTTSNYPAYSTPAINGKAAVNWDGTKNPLKNAAVFPVHCGWIVAKYNDATFPAGDGGYKGLLSDLADLVVLAGNQNSTNFYYYSGLEFFEFRSNDRIYPATAAPAPMSAAYKQIFFRFWKPVIFNGVQLGQDRNLTARKWKGSVALLALYSRNFLEEEIRSYSKIVANNFALPLADVYPYQADINDTPEAPKQSVNFYDPPEGDRISEVIGNPKRVINLKFSNSDQIEVKAMKKYHTEHYAPALPCIYRDYRFTPPEDVEGYIDSPYDLDGSNNDFNYGFRFKEK